MPETLDVVDLLPNKFEPKRQNRWVLAIEGIDAFLVKSAKRPSISFNETTIEFCSQNPYKIGFHLVYPKNHLNFFFSQNQEF